MGIEEPEEHARGKCGGDDRDGGDECGEDAGEDAGGIARGGG